jgi:hypothetical protein
MKRKWNGCMKCVFCDARVNLPFILQMSFCTIDLENVFYFNMAPPANMTNMFGNTLNGAVK